MRSDTRQRSRLGYKRKPLQDATAHRRANLLSPGYDIHFRLTTAGLNESARRQDYKGEES